jgi:hypothetical protein
VPSTFSQRSAIARYIAASAEASSIFRRRAISCSMTGCKAPPSTEERATSATIRRASISLYCTAANAALGARVPDVDTAVVYRRSGTIREILTGPAFRETDTAYTLPFCPHGLQGPSIYPRSSPPHHPGGLRGRRWTTSPVQDACRPSPARPRPRSFTQRGRAG